MELRSELTTVIQLPVPCGHCHKEFMQTVAWLIDKPTVACPMCGAVLDIDGAEWRAFRDAAKEFCVGKFAPVAPIKQGS